MKLFYTLIFFLFIINFLQSQDIELIYDCRKDSNDYIANLKVINGEIFFNSGKERSPKGIAFCGRVETERIKESHVYKLNKDNNCTKVFHHYLENDYAIIEEQIVDSSKIFSNSSFIEFSDTSGVFLFNSSKNEYWLKNKNDYTKKRLAKDESISSYYPKWYNDFLIVRARDSISDGRLWFFNKNDTKLKKLLNDTFLYKAHNLILYNDYLIFHGYSEKLGKDHALFLTNKEGKITKITNYHPNTVFVSYQTIYKEKIIYRVTNRSKKKIGLWEYDIKPGKNKKIYNFPNYGLTYSAREFGENLYFLYGQKNHRLYNLKEGDITEKNDLSKTLDSIIHRNYGGYKINNHQYFIGKSKDKNTRLYSLNINGVIDLVDRKLRNINHLQMVDNNLFFSAVDKNNKAREIYMIKPDNNKIIKISKLKLAKNSKLSIKIETLVDKIYLKIKKENNLSTNLFYLDERKMNIKLIFNDIKKTTSIFTNKLEIVTLNNQIFIISKENEDDKYNQIWKISE